MAHVASSRELRILLKKSFISSSVGMFARRISIPTTTLSSSRFAVLMISASANNCAKNSRAALMPV